MDSIYILTTGFSGDDVKWVFVSLSDNHRVYWWVLDCCLGISFQLSLTISFAHGKNIRRYNLIYYIIE
jgi:hypothetical protein